MGRCRKGRTSTKQPKHTKTIVEGLAHAAHGRQSDATVWVKKRGEIESFDGDFAQLAGPKGPATNLQENYIGRLKK